MSIVKSLVLTSMRTNLTGVTLVRATKRNYIFLAKYVLDDLELSTFFCNHSYPCQFLDISLRRMGRYLRRGFTRYLFPRSGPLNFLLCSHRLEISVNATQSAAC